MLTLSVQDNIAQTIREVEQKVGARVPAAIAAALSATAELVRIAERAEMRDVFDRPTPYTLNSLYVRKATTVSLSARVWLKGSNPGDPPSTPAHYLAAQIAGGSRSWKKFESMLRSVNVLPAGMYAVPGSGAQVDAYGNMARSQIVQILSYFRSFGMAGYSANMNAKGYARLKRGTKKRQGFAYFVGRPGDRLPLGVWQRFTFAHGSAIKPVLIFVPSVRYRKVFDFAFVADAVVRREFNRQFEIALRRAIGGTRIGS